jgi:GWxTD domain-containing protein
VRMLNKTIIFTFLLIILCAANLPAQLGNVSAFDLDEPRFNVDVAAFRTADTDQARLEIYYQVYNDGLKFFKKKDEFIANYELNVVILGEDNKQLNGTSVERIYRLNDYRATRNRNDYLINLVALKIGVGKYKLVAKLIDKNTNKISTVEREFEVKSLFRDENDISDIEFVREVMELDSTPSRFDKGEKRIIPAVSRQYGADIGQISMYFELYHDSDKDKDARLFFDIYDERDKKVYDDDFELKLNKPVIRFIKHVPLDNFMPGEYQVRVTLAENNGKAIASTKADFSVAWSLQALITNDYDLAVEQLKFVARKPDLDKLKKASPEKREEAFLEFWKSKDPTPETPENELMEKYYARIQFANRAFSSIHKDGWKTDMGMVYIIYGEPDQVERHPFELSSKPYQVWYYYSLSRTFGFVDENGTGEYFLQFPYDGRSGFIDDKIDDYN